MRIILVLPLRRGLLGEFDNFFGRRGCANDYKFAIFVFAAGVTQLVE